MATWKCCYWLWQPTTKCYNRPWILWLYLKRFKEIYFCTTNPSVMVVTRLIRPTMRENRRNIFGWINHISISTMQIDGFLVLIEQSRSNLYNWLVKVKVNYQLSYDRECPSRTLHSPVLEPLFIYTDNLRRTNVNRFNLSYGKKSQLEEWNKILGWPDSNSKSSENVVSLMSTFILYRVQNETWYCHFWGRGLEKSGEINGTFYRQTKQEYFSELM